MAGIAAACTAKGAMGGVWLGRWGLRLLGGAVVGVEGEEEEDVRAFSCSMAARCA